MLDPVGPLPPRVYWVRRLAVLGVVLVVVALLVWVTVGRQPSEVSPAAASVPTTLTPMTGELATPSVSASATESGTATSPADTSAATASVTDSAAEQSAALSAASSAADAQAAATVEASTASQPAADTGAADAQASTDAAAAVQAQASADAAAAAAAAAEEADAAAEAAAAEAARPRDAEGRLICPDSSVALVATVGQPSYAIGQQPVVGVTVTNTGSEACVRDLSGGLQEFLAFDAAGNRVWSTSDCIPGTGTDVRFLQPGESLQYNIKWSGTTSQPGCTGERVQVPPGEYQIEVKIGGAVSSRAVLAFQ